jgi:hypothetical protein
MLCRRATIGCFSGSVSQAQLPDSAGDAARLDHEAVRPVLRDARREGSRFILRDKGK